MLEDSPKTDFEPDKNDVVVEVLEQWPIDKRKGPDHDSQKGKMLEKERWVFISQVQSPGF